MSTTDKSFGGTSMTFSWDLLNEQPRVYRCSALFSVCKKFKRKGRKRKAKDGLDDGSQGQDVTDSLKKREPCRTEEDGAEDDPCVVGTSDCVDTSTCKLACVVPDTDGHLRPTAEKRVPSAGEQWEVDSGFASEASPPNSGRCSPCVGSCPTKVVAIDCEMVGTGPRGQCSELARCSVLNYAGDVLYDQYVRPSQPVTNFRTRWSGIRKEHLKLAVPFKKARRQIAALLKDKVVIGHALHNDFKALQFSHPRHMIRDTSSSRALRLMCGSHSIIGFSLKTLSQKLLNRRIQVGRAGHCSVEDAKAALDLYKLVEEQWEQQCAEMKAKHSQAAPAHVPNPEPSLSHYMSDQYWPDHMDCSQ